ncbi:MAG: TlpA disulfide reductase family protein [Fimbriimonas sp.]|nr:TlpA disulfide reductase family protein [Fimbriimonas sp.]
MKFYALLLFLLLALGCAPERGANVDFRASPLKPGGDITFSKEYAGKPALIYVWATWCGPCREVGPGIEELKKEYAARGIAFLAVAQDKMGAVRQFEQATPHDMDVLIDYWNDLAKVIDTSAIPVIAVVDSNHNIVVMERGVPTDGFATIKAALDAVAKS